MNLAWLTLYFLAYWEFSTGNVYKFIDKKVDSSVDNSHCHIDSSVDNSHWVILWVVRCMWDDLYMIIALMMFSNVSYRSRFYCPNELHNELLISRTLRISCWKQTLSGMKTQQSSTVSFVSLLSQNVSKYPALIEMHNEI